tara:strand:- start:10017 stop:10586 length:570 start_codon:yes stop_codon:yes gene_type:complete
MESNTIHKQTIAQQPNFIGLPQAKEHLKIRFDYEDDLIQTLITAAIQATEDYTGLQIFQSTIELGFTVFPIDIKLNYGPVLGDSVSIKYDNISKVETEFVADYKVLKRPNLRPNLIFSSENGFPETDISSTAVRVSYVAGMNLEDLPKPLVIAILLQIADLYLYRTDRSEITNTRAMALMRPYRIWDYE